MNRFVRALGKPACLAARLSVILLTIAFGASAHADQGEQDFQLNLFRHHYVAVETDSEGGPNDQTLEAAINGRKVQFLIDTGAATTCLKFGEARHLKLNVLETGKAVTGVGGQTHGSAGLASISSFQVSHFEINHLNPIEVLPRDAELFAADGLFGLDVLYLNAAILPVGGRGIMLKPGNTPTVPLDSFYRPRGFSPVPVELSRGRLLMHGSCCGRPLVAMIDSGASFSLFEIDYVRSILGGTPAGINGQFRGVDGQIYPSYQFTPRNLSLEGFKIPSLMVVSSTSPSLKSQGINALIGYDILADHQAVIDLGARVIWMK